MKKLFVALFAILAFSAFAADEPAPDADMEAVDVAPPEEDVKIETFHEKMKPHGKWIEDKEHGKVWQPSVVVIDTDWRPYCNEGHWVWTNCGWYWQSNYEWGNYAFHYGRWVRHAQHRWVWVPDCTWGPAWVSWRECDDAWGWAALPPIARFDFHAGFGAGVDFSFRLGVDDFVFVGCRDFLRVRVHKHCYPRKRCHEVYGRTKIINNTYIVRNKTVINNGVSCRIVERRTNRRIEPSRINRGHVHKAPVHRQKDQRFERRDDRRDHRNQMRNQRQEHNQNIQRQNQQHRQQQQQQRIDNRQHRQQQNQQFRQERQQQRQQNRQHQQQQRHQNHK